MSLHGKVFKLANEHTIPAVGYGTGTKWYKAGVNELDTNLVNTLVKAIDLGFTHIDGAEVYNTNEEIGEAIIKSKVKRDNIFVTSKYWPGVDEPNKQTPYDSLKASLSKLKLEYVDLYLIHTPFITKEKNGFDLVEAWNSIEKLVDEGLVKSAGVSNFTVENIETILKSNPKHKPVVNQIEYSAYLQNQTPNIVKFAKENGILIEAYGPLGPLTKAKGGPLDSVLESLAKKYNKTDSQILLRWVLETGVLPVTTSSKEERIKSYLDILNFELTSDEVKQISEVGSTKTYRQFFSNYSIYD
ncbi:aldose reductase [Scheffersomyces amazonensis]|uniref:aldose reductase n=1 Tax=Scheffersomyces amazonensis TaxID=1078765 RepID=UPI00315D5D33